MNGYYNTGYYNMNTAGTATAARRTGKTGRVSRAVRRNRRTIAFVVSMVLCVFMIVYLSCIASQIQAKNNDLEEQNKYLEAEIDSLSNEITDETTLDKLEKTASNKYGMVYPNSSNYVKIKDDSKTSRNLANEIKDEVYG